MYIPNQARNLAALTIHFTAFLLEAVLAVGSTLSNGSKYESYSSFQLMNLFQIVIESLFAQIVTLSLHGSKGSFVTRAMFLDGASSRGSTGEGCRGCRADGCANGKSNVLQKRLPSHVAKSQASEMREIYSTKIEWRP